MSDNKENSKQKSAVWDYFEKLDSKFAQCKICFKNFSSGSSTSSLLKHLKNLHKINTSSNDDEMQDQSMNSELNSSVDMEGSNNRKRKFPSVERPCSDEKYNQLMDMMIDVVIENNLPLSFIESISFKNLMKEVEPNFKVPCTETLKKKIKYKESLLKNEIKSNLNEAFSVSLTTDAWTSIRHDAHLSITASYISKSWELKTPTLATLNLTERHTLLYLSSQILNVSQIIYFFINSA